MSERNEKASREPATVREAGSSRAAKKRVHRRVYPG